MGSGYWPECMKVRAYCPIDPLACEAVPDRSGGLQVLGVFRDMLGAARRSVGTQRVFVGLVRRWLDAGGVAGHLDSGRFATFLRRERDRVGASQCNNIISACRAFYRAMAAAGHCAPGEDLRLPKLRRPPRPAPRYLTADQVAALLAAPDPRTWLGCRDAAVLRLLAGTGLRTGQLVGLTLGDVLADDMLYVRGSCRDRDRYVPLSPELRAAIDDWLRRRCEAHPGKRSALFVTARGLPMGADTARRIVDHHARASLGRAMGIAQLARAGVPWAGHSPALLRASAAMAWHDRGVPATTIAQLLGQADVASAVHYVAADIAPLRAAVAHHPRARSSTR